jgi:hypothetical protein
LPSKAGIITTKILRLDDASCVKRKSNLRLKVGVKYSESSELAPVPIQSSSSATKREPPYKDKVTKKEAPEPQRKPTPTASETKPKPQSAPAKKEQQPAPQPIPKQKPVVREANLLDGDDQPSSPKPLSTGEKSQPNIAKVDVPAPAPIPEPVAPPPPAEPAPSREELVAKREALVQEQVDAALDEKRKV